MKVRITADSTCDLSPELLRKYDIALAPLSVIIDGEVFHDGVDVTPRDVFRAADAGKSVRTAAVNAYEYKEFFGKQLRNCDQLVHICISSEFSTCYADACEAAAETGNVFVVDSRNLSTGSGLLALEGWTPASWSGRLITCAGAAAAADWRHLVRKCCISVRPSWSGTGKCIPATSIAEGMNTT